MTPHCYIIILILVFYANHLHIFGMWRAFHVEFLNDDKPELGVVEDSKNIFWKVTVWCVKHLGKFHSKPFVLCPVCMASIHSTYIYWTMAVIIGVHWWMLPLYLVYVPALAGLNYLKMEGLK